MPFRVIGYDGPSYRDQIYYFKDEEGRTQKSKERYPVIALVLYFGHEKRWGAAKSLYETFTSEVPEYLKPYVQDYRINLFEIAYLTDEQVARFKSDFREVADYFTQMRKNGSYVPSERQITHVREVLDLMAVLTGDNRFAEHIDELERSKEGVTMCKVLDEVENRGRAAGEQNAKLLDIRNVMESLGVGVEKAMDILKIAGSERRTYAGLVNAN